MNESVGAAPVGKSRLPGVSKWLAIAGLALLVFFVITAYINRNHAEVIGPLLLSHASFTDVMSESFAVTLGGTCGAVFIASSSCTVAALVTGVASLRATAPADPRAKIGLALATASVALTVVVAISLNLGRLSSHNIINLVR